MDSLDDLDNALFGTKNFETKQLSSATEPKKKVMFKVHETNDNTEDLNLSDNDDDDDDDVEDSLKENSLDIANNDKIANLFGIKSDKKEETDVFFYNNKNTQQGYNNSPKFDSKKSDFSEELQSNLTTVKFKNQEQTSVFKMKSLFDDDSNDIANLTESKTKTSSSSSSSDPSKKSMLIKDLFGKRPKSSSEANSNLRKNSLVYDDINSERPNTEKSYAGFVNEDTNKSTVVSGYSLSTKKEPVRRGRRASTIQNDPLGFLSTSNLQLQNYPLKVIENEVDGNKREEMTNKTDNLNDLPDWLGGSRNLIDQNKELERIQSSSSAKLSESMKKSSTDLASTIPVESTDESPVGSKLLGIEFDQQAAMISMQQQEYELRTAAVLAQQSEKLNYLAEVQRMKLTEQEKQFDALISRQLERQTLLEAQMRAQQQRIDNYIQTLVAQPTSLPAAMRLVTEKNDKLDLNKIDNEMTEKSESLVQKLELEKFYLENTLDSLKQRHEKEMSLLEDSYKKQVAFLEESMIQMEKRMRDDAENIESEYKAKIIKLKTEILDCHKDHLDEKDVLKEENLKLIQEIRDHYNKNLEILQKEHLESVDRITRSKESERRAIEIMRSEGINIQNILNKSQVIVESLEDLHKKFEIRDNNFATSQTNHLSIQEKNIEYLKENMEKQKNNFFEEKQKLTDTIRNLESNMTELTKEFKTQSKNFREGEEILKLREQALLRDREIFTEQTTWERERLQAMRDAWSKDYSIQLEWLSQERQTLAAEKGKLQISNKLKLGVDESLKLELEATIKAAQDAATGANQERLKWQEKKNELEVQKKTFSEKENQLLQRAKELQEFTQSAIEKKEEGLQALKEARFIEARYKEKLKQLQLQQEILTQRESKLATEKLQFAHERLVLRINDDMPEKDTTSNETNKSNYYIKPGHNIEEQQFGFSVVL